MGEALCASPGAYRDSGLGDSLASETWAAKPGLGGLGMNLEPATLPGGANG